MGCTYISQRDGGGAVAISATVSDWDHGISGHRDRNPADKVERDFEGAWRRPGEMNASGIASLLAFCYLVFFLCAAASRLASSALRQGLFNRAGFERVHCARTGADWGATEERVMGRG
jgi:hypothetical protein